MTKICNKGYTPERHRIGVQQEDEFALLMECHHLEIKSLSKSDPYCSVDFRVPGTNAYIELKSRNIKQGDFKDLLLDTAKISRWKKELHDAVIYIAFGFIGKKYSFIKYDEKLFNTFKTNYLSKYDINNVLIPVDKCMDFNCFVNEIRQYVIKKPSPITDSVCEDSRGSCP